MNQIIRKLIIGSIALYCTAACTTSRVDTKVTRYFDNEINSKSGTFIVLPFSDQEHSVEFYDLSSAITNHLNKLGYQKTEDFKQADYAVFYYDGIDDGSMIVRNYPIFGKNSEKTIYSGSITAPDSISAFKNSYRSRTYNYPEFDVMHNEFYDKVQAKQFLKLELVDIKKSDDTDIHKAFEATVLLSGYYDNDIKIKHCLLDAVFEEFPGTNQKTTNVVLDKNQCM